MDKKDTNLLVHYQNYLSMHEDFPKVSKPRVIGGFSINKNREYMDTLDQLKYLHNPGERVHWDLNEGYEIFQKRDRLSNNIYDILQFIMRNWKKMKLPQNHPESNQRCFAPEFVAFRGLLRCLMCTPYECGPKSDGWVILATKFKGTIYLCERDSPQKEASRLNETEDIKRFSYYGYKFEQYILNKKLHNPNDTSLPVIEAEELGVVYQSSFGNHRLLYVAETDGVIADTPIPLDADLAKVNVEFVEVKTKKRAENFYQERNFVRYKLRNWWCQCFIVGIETVVVGVRTPEGIVKKIEKMQVKEMAKIGEQQWSASICMNFCVKFLDTVKDLLRHEESPDTVYKFTFNPRARNCVQYCKLPKNSDPILPPWYVEFLNNL